MKFLCDDNLGKLARYLRMLGHDTFYKSSLTDPELLATMLAERRFVITRDHNLAGRLELGRFLLIDTDSPEEQLKAVITDLKLEIDKAELFSRCLECNEVCVDVSPDDIKDEVFPYVIKTHDQFRRCPACGRIYWQGSHYEDMLEKLEKIIGLEDV